MARFTGQDLYAEWVYSGGTVTISGDQTSMDIAPSVNLINSDAADDGWMTRLVGVKDFTVNWSARIDQTVYVSVEDALAEGNIGTLYVYPWGTAASGKRKYTCPVISNGASFQWPYDNVVEGTNSFSGNGTITRGTT